MDKQPINVLIVEDSPVVQLLLTHALNADPQLHVMGTANDGNAALEFLSHNHPDVILMDVNMPRMNGFEATRKIMETHPLPIIMCSATLQRSEVDTTFRALEAGALLFVEKPPGPGHPRYNQLMGDLIQSIKLMTEIKVVKRWAQPAKAPPPPKIRIPEITATTKIRIVAIGASTGGPPVIQQILAELPRTLPVPILIVQHIAPGFVDGMLDWLKQTSSLPVLLAADGEQALAGHAYLAPDGHQIEIDSNNKITLTNTPAGTASQPSVSHLFRSVAEAFGASAVGVLLTGMGRDGAAELKLLRDKGAVTIAQDADSSIVFGMPGEAVRIGAATHVLPPSQIAAFLSKLVFQK